MRCGSPWIAADPFCWIEGSFTPEFVLYTRAVDCRSLPSRRAAPEKSLTPDDPRWSYHAEPGWTERRLDSKTASGFRQPPMRRNSLEDSGKKHG